MVKRVAVALLAVLTATALLFSGVALAQTGTPTIKNPPFFQDFLEKLAANLGVDQGKLQEAVKQTELQMVDEAVQQGRLTPKQAEKIKQRIENGRLFPLEPIHFKKALRSKRLNMLAQALGMTPEELRAELRQGKKISDIAQEKGLTMEQLRQKLIEARIQAIQQAVKDGKIPQDRADRIIERLQKALQKSSSASGSATQVNPSASENTQQAASSASGVQE